MSDYDARFWMETDRYHSLAKQIEQGVSVTHPSGHFDCKLDGFTSHCPFCATSVKYYEYRGSNL